MGTPPYDIHRWKATDLGFNLAQSNRDLKDLTSRQNFGDTSGLLCKNDLIPCHIWDGVLVIWYDLFGGALEMGGYFVFGVFSNACTSNIWDVVLLIWYDSFGICWDLLQCV